jgi:hypothetical protein
MIVEPSELRAHLERMRQAADFTGWVVSINGAEPIPGRIHVWTDRNDYGDGVMREGLSEWAISIAVGIRPTFEMMHIRMGVAAGDLEYTGKAIWRSTEGDGEGKWRTELMGCGLIERGESEKALAA